ncbi:hypothetical protein N7445_000014 [Penicillium cf. griseofulvum]|nr:hypothetical protein N7445_000014 [Penicillium cf. griseofulvum]
MLCESYPTATGMGERLIHVDPPLQSILEELLQKPSINGNWRMISIWRVYQVDRQVFLADGWRRLTIGGRGLEAPGLAGTVLTSTSQHC